MKKKIGVKIMSIWSKKKKRPARLERRVRVTFFLVAETKEQINAADSVGIYLQTQYLLDEKEREIPVTGFTFSAFPEPIPLPAGKSVFIGYWWHTTEAERKRLMREKVILFLIDFPIVAEEWKTDENINLLKDRILESYEENHCPQEEIWIVKQDIYRYA